MLTALIHRLEATPDGAPGGHLPDLYLFRQTRPHRFEAMIYEPLVCLILQGEKEISVGGQAVVAQAGDMILASHPLPIVARVRTASPEAPYLSVVVTLDLVELRALDTDMPAHTIPQRPSAALSVTPISNDLVSVFARYLDLAQDSLDAKVLGRSVRRELHWRLLQSGCGGMLRQLLKRDSHASRIAQAVVLLRKDFRRRVDVDAVARAVGMSPSAFYKHFKATTSTTPLQYHKALRLTEARRLLFGGEHTVATAAFAVGYESASQFSREYSRKFGGPPSHDLAHRRTVPYGDTA